MGRNRSATRSLRPLPLAAALSLGLAAGCALGTDDLAAFRETATGPAKLRAVLRDDSRPPSLRAEAALQLLDLERADVNARALLFDALAHLEPPSRRAIVPGFTEGLHARMRLAPGTPPVPRAVRAKDAGVKLLALLDAPERAQLGGALVRWIGADPERRADCGEFTLEGVAAQLGSASAVPTAESLGPSLKPPALTRLVASVEQYGDARARTLAGEKLVAIEQAYRRHPELQGALLAHVIPALGRFVDTEPARKRLVAIAHATRHPESERQRALTLLEGAADERDLPELSAIALDQNAPLSLRELALARIGETRSRAALPTLIALVATRTQRSLRQPRRRARHRHRRGAHAAGAVSRAAEPLEHDLRKERDRRLRRARRATAGDALLNHGARQQAELALVVGARDRHPLLRACHTSARSDLAPARAR